jgi:large subunit ribosomal protein L21
MYAVILTGGKQYKVKSGDVINIEKLDLGVGDTVDFDKVLMLIDGEKVELGTPYLSGKTVKGEVVAQMRGKKIRIIKFRRRKHSMKRQGHRQYLTTVRIIEVAGNKVAAKASAAKKTETQSAAEKKAPAKKTEAKPAAEKKTPAKKPAAKKTQSQSTAKKPAAKKTTATKKPAAKKTVSKES